MTLNFAFFDDYEECVYSCDAHMPAGVDDPTTTDPACVPCPVEMDWRQCGQGEHGPVGEARICTHDTLPNWTVSLVAWLMLAPIIGIVQFIFASMRKPLIVDIMLRSGEIWAMMQSETVQEHARKRESLMLTAMTPTQVHAYAQEIADATTQKQRVDPEILNRIVANTKREHGDDLQRLKAELKEHVVKQERRKALTQSHQECLKNITSLEQQITQRQKEEMLKAVLASYDEAARTKLTHELTCLSLQELRARQAEHRIKFTVEDEDAWSQGGIYQNSSLQHAVFLSMEEKRLTEEHQNEAQKQIDTEKEELIEMIVDAELRQLGTAQKLYRRIRSLRPDAMLRNCLDVQRRWCTTICPWCQKTISVTFDEEGPLGIRFVSDGTHVKVVAIKEHYQADLNESVEIGLVLREIDGNKIDSTDRYRILEMLHNTYRPTTLVFILDDGVDQSPDLTDSEETDRCDDSNAAGGNDAFWDDEEVVSPQDQFISKDVGDIEIPTVAQAEDDLPQQYVEEASLQLQKYGAALVAKQRLENDISAMEAVIDETTTGSSTSRAQKMKDLAKTRQDLTEAQEHAVDAADDAGYDFIKCTVHVERVPDTLGPDSMQSLFSAFGRVLQVTLQRRPGINSSWALVTMCDVNCVTTILNYSNLQHSTDLTNEQHMQMKNMQILRASKMFESSYGRSWLEATERAEASIRGIALLNSERIRNDFGVLVTTTHSSKNGTKPEKLAAPRRRAPVCERRRQIAGQMRVCETAVDALFYACDRDSSGTLDREELAILMAELNGGPRVSEFAVQFVIDQVQSHGEGAITREQLKPAITLWRYLQHEQEYVAQQFDLFDKRIKGQKIGRNEVGLLLKLLNSDKDNPEGIPPSVAEVDWVMNMARSTSGVDRAELRAAVALWYPMVYNRRRVEDLPATEPLKAGRRRRAIAGMLGMHKHTVSMVLTAKYPIRPDPDDPTRIKLYKLTVHELMLTMSDLISTTMGREHATRADAEFVVSLADLQGAETFEASDVKAALTMWLCTRYVQADLDASMQQYDSSKSPLEQRQLVRQILTDLNDGIPVTLAETDWILESSDIDGNGTISHDEMRASVAWWFLHVARGRLVKVKRGWDALLPWLLAACVTLVCAYVVATISVRYTEAKTQRWLENTVLTVVLKLLIADLLRVLLCEMPLEPLVALLRFDEVPREFDQGHSMEDLREGGTNTLGAMVVAQAAAGQGDWNKDTESTVEQVHKGNHASAILTGSRSVSKLMSIAKSKQVKSHALNAATDAARDSQQLHQRMRSQRAEMNAVYATKVAERRIQRGLNRGAFAERASSDLVAVSQFMAAEQETTKAEERALVSEIRDLREQENVVLTTPATLRRHDELKRIRHQLARADERRQTIAKRQGDIKHEHGNEKLLLAKAKREEDTHRRHISHLQGLSSAKTMERIRRKRDAKRGIVVLKEDSGRGLDRSLMKAKSARGLLQAVAGDGRVAVRPEVPTVGDAVDAVDAVEMTSLDLADAGMRRSATQPKQLKVVIPAGPLPGAPTQRSLMDEVDEIRAEEATHGSTDDS